MRSIALAVLTVLAALLCRGTSLGSEVFWIPAHDLAPVFAGSAIAAGDLDDDGDDDVGDLDYWRAYWNHGCPGPPSWEVQDNAFPNVGSCMENSGTFGDCDGDGDLDLVYACWECCSFRMIWNIGTPQGPSWQYGGAVAGDPWSGYNAYVQLCDMDADGDLDLVGTNASGVVTLHQNTGTPLSPYWVFLELIPGIGFGASCGRLALADLDGDSDQDIVWAVRGGPVKCWENVGTPHSCSYVENPAMLTGVARPPHGVFGLALLDVDCDGDCDLLMGGGYNEGYLYLNERITPVSPASWGTIKALYR